MHNDDVTLPANLEDRLAQIALAYQRATEAGEAVNRQEWLARYPDVAGELTVLLDDPERLERLARLLQDSEQTLPRSEFATRSWEGTDAAAAPPLRARYIGDYELLQEIGHGGMGVVYKARHVSLKRIVALKMILGGAVASASDLARFRAEAEAVAALQHSNIIQIHNIGEQDGLPFFALEYIEGGSLAEKLNGTPLPGRQAAELLQTLALAIHHAHQHGIIHRDLKPANILLHRKSEISPDRGTASAIEFQIADFQPKVTDFGLAKRLGETSAHTQTGTIVGTPSYMAPEQAEARSGDLGPATDVYALGAILYELLTGRPPFRAATPLDTVLQVIHGEPISPQLLNPKVNRDLETICLKCLQKNPAQRYASAQELAEDLGRYCEGRPIKARPVGRVVRLWRWCRRHPGAAALLALALLSLLTLFTVVSVYNGRLQEELHQTEQAQREVQMALTRQVAERLDGDLRQLAGVPQLMALTLAQRPDWTPRQLAAWMEQMLHNDARLFGTCVAFEPHQFDKGQQDFALYVCRKPGGLETKQLSPETYRPLYRDWDWYTAPKRQARALWSEPFVDEGGGDIPMITYSVPLRRQNKFIGVVTADLSVEYFRVLRSWLGDLNLGERGYGFVVTSTGTFISHPDPKYQMPRKITEVSEFQEDQNLRELTRRVLKGETGSTKGVDPSTGRASEFFFAPVPSAGWSFVAVADD